MESVLRRQTYHDANQSLETADKFLNVGYPVKAERILDAIRWQDSSLDVGQKKQLAQKLAKAYRRLAKPRKIKGIIDDNIDISLDYNFIMQYELALAKWTEAAENNKMSGNNLWTESLNIINQQIPLIKGHNSTSDRRMLQWQTALVNIKSLRSLIIRGVHTCREDELNRLELSVKTWLSGKNESIELGDIIKKRIDNKSTKKINKKILDTWLSKKHTDMEQEKELSQLLNSLRALCRGYLSCKQNHNKAKIILNLIEEILSEKNDPQLISLIDLFLLQAWEAKLSHRDNLTSNTLLNMTGHMLRTLDDPVLKAFREGIVNMGKKSKRA